MTRKNRILDKQVPLQSGPQPLDNKAGFPMPMATYDPGVPCPWPPTGASLTALTSHGARDPPGDDVNLAGWTGLWAVPWARQDRVTLENRCALV